MTYLVTMELLEFYDQYDGDFGLLEEPWAPKEDRNQFTDIQLRTLGEYVDALAFAKVEALSQQLRLRTENRIQELEKNIAPEVVKVIRSRFDAPEHSVL